MGNVIKVLSSILLGCVCLLACSDNDEGKEDDAVFSIIGFWSGEIGYSCSDGEHQGKSGAISFETDGTGVLVEAGEEPAPFHYEMDSPNKKVTVLFEDGRRGEYRYTELTGTQLIFVEVCPVCGKEMIMKLKHIDRPYDITVSSTEGYIESFQSHFDTQLRVSAIDYQLIDTDGEGDGSAGTVDISYTSNKVHMTNALLSNHTLYTAVFTLNDKGWATKADCTYQSVDNDYSGSGTLYFTYDSQEHLKSISYSYSSTSGVESGSVKTTWSENLMTAMKGEGDDYQAGINYRTDPVPELSINLPYFMLFRYDDDAVSCGGDNVILCYASLLNILGKAPQRLMDRLVNGNDDWQNIFSFDYEWSDGRLTKIHDHSSYNGDGATAENYDAEISLSYY
ncbi:DUF4595 domain-containing protein [Bacteroides faecium]|uniref:DUF4595 domain-containing protein n=1 Tax=Bacteroides faecium TaxID=2715212 RepID=A0A6H0KK55_9BACE|nr:DUF4595 domain-containing protein [Bacteroides faecium]QIU93816.1 DUF4595 domain-containing protein [Bacteroides faecium]